MMCLEHLISLYMIVFLKTNLVDKKHRQASNCLPADIVDGLTENGWLGLLTGIICLAIAMVIIRARVPVIDAEKD